MSHPLEPVQSCRFLDETMAALNFRELQTREIPGRVLAGNGAVDFICAAELVLQGGVPAHRKLSGAALGEP